MNKIKWCKKRNKENLFIPLLFPLVVGHKFSIKMEKCIYIPIEEIEKFNNFILYNCSLRIPNFTPVIIIN